MLELRFDKFYVRIKYEKEEDEREQTDLSTFFLKIITVQYLVLMSQCGTRICYIINLYSKT